MQQRLGGQNVGPLRHQFGGQADRQVDRQMQLGEGEGLVRLLARRHADEGRDQIALLAKLLVQRRQQLLHLGKRGFLRHDIGLGDLAEAELAAQDVEQVGLARDLRLRRVDLAAQRRFLHRRAHHVGNQREVGRLQLVALVVGLRLQVFHQAAVGAEHVGRERHAEIGGEQRVVRDCPRRRPARACVSR